MVVEKTALPSRVRPVGSVLRAFIMLGSWLGIASLAALLVAEAGSWLGLSVYSADSAIPVLSAYGGAVAAVVALIAGIWLRARHKRWPSVLLIVGMLAGLVAFWVPFSAKQNAQRANSGAVAPAADATVPAPSSDAGR